MSNMLGDQDHKLRVGLLLVIAIASITLQAQAEISYLRLRSAG